MVEVLAVSRLWVACWSSDNAGGELAACSDEWNSSPGKALDAQRRRVGGLSETKICQRLITV